MTAPQLLRDLTAQGVLIDVRGDRLHVMAPKGVLTESVKSQLRSVKPHLLQLLGGPVAYRRARGDERCGRCRDLAARGVAVLACSVCDVRLAQ